MQFYTNNSGVEKKILRNIHHQILSHISQSFSIVHTRMYARTDECVRAYIRVCAIDNECEICDSIYDERTKSNFSRHSRNEEIYASTT